MTTHVGEYSRKHVSRMLPKGLRARIPSVISGIPYGLEGAMAGEVLEFPGNLFGIVLNLEEDNVGAAVFGSVEGIK